MNVIWGEENWKVRGKWLLVVSVALIGLNLLLNQLIYRQQTSFEVEGTLFRYEAMEGEEIFFRDRERDRLTVTMENPENNPVSFATDYQVSYQNYQLQVASNNFFEQGFRIHRNTGSDYTQTITDSGWSSGAGRMPSRNHGEIKNLPYDVQLVYGLESTVPTVKEGFIGNWGRLFFAFTLISIGAAFVILLPDIAWKVEHFLWVEKGEPSELYLGLHITLGILTMILIFGFYFFALL
ncbi:hypothetical protein [Isachenkonia alkalipeptolytica]|uniref:Uncharacterized protein n=1 Tax=Isachenkonia alkalipeptolytica TaxID=2565777 RepID=A0AA44BDE4_9CLOT|nr:hypothetical protein [Isachenkonia alkalipeptolytica]NBG87867.1 hypothetical protein [Isachenkonia alkalipeptolytica]